MAALNQKVDFQSKIFSQMEKTNKELRSRVYLLMDHANRLGKK